MCGRSLNLRRAGLAPCYSPLKGHRVLLAVFPVTGLTALFMACPLMSTFTVGALGMAVAIGLGNGAVFKLVPEYFPKAVGSVTGLVGAAGGLGGFFPPLFLGVIRQGSSPGVSSCWPSFVWSVCSCAEKPALVRAGKRDKRRWSFARFQIAHAPGTAPNANSKAPEPHREVCEVVSLPFGRIYRAFTFLVNSVVPH
jgi:MFS family permease